MLVIWKKVLSQSSILWIRMNQIYHDLDNLAGTWSEKDVKEFQENVEDLERIDKEIWI